MNKQRITAFSGLLTLFLALVISNNLVTKNIDRLVSDRDGFSKRQYNLAKWKYQGYFILSGNVVMIV